MDKLYDKLIQYSKEGYYPMHMPGHKRNTAFLPMGNPYGIDITEIEGFDNLHQAEGILNELSVRISDLYHTGKAYPLVNGSTAGILAGISAATKKGDRILMARNCHKSVYHAAILRELEPVYIYPQPVGQGSVNGGILPGKIEELLINDPKIRLVVITSPTYEGIVSDIRAIADIVHRYGALLLVDEAHGAHFGFHDKFPQSAATLGADLVIHSLHKTLPAFTQTAVLHSNCDTLNHKIEEYLTIYQTSSPSYILLSGIDRCVSILEDSANELFDAWEHKLEEFRHALGGLGRLSLLNREIVGQAGVYDLDPSKLVIFAGGTAYTGHQLGRILREEYKIVMEMEAGDYVLGMTSICDTKEGFDRLANALLAIDGEAPAESEDLKPVFMDFIKTDRQLQPYEAVECESEKVELTQSCGRVSAGFISLFPPGSPLVVPGEIFRKDIIEYMKQALSEGLTVIGLCGENKDLVPVICRQFMHK